MAVVRFLFTILAGNVLFQLTCVRDGKDGLEQQDSSTALCEGPAFKEACIKLESFESQNLSTRLSRVFHASQGSVNRFLFKIYGRWGGIQKLFAPSMHSLTCEELCKDTINTIAKKDSWRLPNKIDLGCRQGIGDEPPAVCDVDLSVGAMAQLHGDGREVRKPNKLLQGWGKFKDSESENVSASARSIPVDYEVHDMLRKVANLFRVYPLLSMTIVEDSHTGDVVADNVDGLRALNDDPSKQAKSRMGLNKQSTVRERSIDDGSLLDIGQDIRVGDRVLISDTRKVATVLSIDGESVTVRLSGEQDSHHLPLSMIEKVGMRVGDLVQTHYIYGNGQKSSGTDVAKVVAVSPANGSVDVEFDEADGPIVQGVPHSFITGIKRGEAWATPLPKLPITPIKTQVMRDIQTRSIQAQKYVTDAISNLRHEDTIQHITKWYGPDNHDHIIDRLAELLNHLDNMLANVHYIYPGSTCESDTYAYVQPAGMFAKDEANKFVFYLCELYLTMPADYKYYNGDLPLAIGTKVTAYYKYESELAFLDDEPILKYGVISNVNGERVEVEFKIDDVPTKQWMQNSHDAIDAVQDPRRIPQLPGVQIETLTHEGSHHGPAFTNDVCASTGLDSHETEDECDVAYGRSTCVTLAEEHPAGALDNADSLCYFINDVNGDLER